MGRKSGTSRQLAISLSTLRPVDAELIRVWEDKKLQLPVGHGDFAGGSEFIRRLLLRGYMDYCREFPGILKDIEMKEAKTSKPTPPPEPTSSENPPEKPKAGAHSSSAPKRSIEDQVGGGPI